MTTERIDVLAAPSFIAQVRRGSEWETIRYADKRRNDLLGKSVVFDSQEEALAAGRRAWGPIKASEGDDYRALARVGGA